MSVLIEADQLINGDRAEAYGDAKENLDRIGTLWGQYLYLKHGLLRADGEGLSAEDVAWMMVLLKMARQMHKPSHENVVDAAGYIGLVEKVSAN